MICKNCGASNRIGELLCHVCGDMLSQPPISALTGTEPLEAAEDTLNLPTLVTLELDEHIYRATIGDGGVLLIGRDFEPEQAEVALDLAEMSGLDRGISRLHAAIEVVQGAPYLVDLESTNHTYLNGMRLPPNQPALLRNGDVVHFSSLEARVRVAHTSVLQNNHSPAEARRA